MTTAATSKRWSRSRILWGTTSFLILVHFLAVVGIVHLALAFSLWSLLLGLVWYALCGFSITAGYHRLFSHRSYRASALVRAFFLGFGAAACQRSALKWCDDHRVHHRQTDQPEDPYSVTHGFWWAHCGWVISEALPRNSRPPRDLCDDPLVLFQHRYWGLLAVLLGCALPSALGLLWGDPLGAFLIAGPLRIVLTWHSTYSVNSFAHRFGSRPYSTSSSARDSFWVALFTLGEGYHNFHHRFQADYRNGIRWYHYDPTKWLVWTLSRFGLVRDLKRIPKQAIAQSRQKETAQCGGRMTRAQSRRRRHAKGSRATPRS